MSAATDSVESAYQLHRLTPQYAEQIPALTLRVNGPSYVHAEVYHPERLLRMNESGDLVSVVALHGSGEVVGHCALERPGRAAIAETGEAMVLPEHRHHHLLDRMHGYLDQLAGAIGILGLRSDAVTHHTFSQLTLERFHSTPTAIQLAALPASADHVEDTYPQRLSFIDYFKYLSTPPEAIVHLPERHRTICEQIFDGLGRKVRFGAPERAAKPGELDAEYAPDKQRATIAVKTPGADTAARIRGARDEYCASAGAAAVFVEVPLSDSGTAALCDELEQHGFFFSGVKIGEPPAGDVLRMQFLKCPLDLSLVRLDGDLAHAILDYIGAERKRVSR